MRHKFIKISLVVISIIVFCIMLFIYFYDFPSQVWELGKGYYIEYNPNSDLSLIRPRHNCFVSGPIIKYSFNDKYVTVKEKPRLKIDSVFGLDKIEYYPDYKNAFAKIQYYNYWIIDKRIDSIFGPYEKYDFQLKFKELNLPDSLMIK